MIWIIGSRGMLGRELSQYLRDKGYLILETDTEVDIGNITALRQFAAEYSVSLMVNCAAYTAVDRAEADAEAAYDLNVRGAGNAARLARELQVPLIHISTDYVFDGVSSIPLTEEDAPNPQGVYGRTKYQGEEEIRAQCPGHYIIRTSWLYGRHGKNFVTTMLDLMNQKDELKVVDDQVGSPTWTRSLCRFIHTVMTAPHSPFGTYHFSGEGQCSWYEFACEIYRRGKALGLVDRDCEIVPCSSDEYPAAARRPAYSLLSKNKIREVYDFANLLWQDALEEFLQELTALRASETPAR